MSNAKRITELDELTTLSGGEYVIVDHPTNGTKKYQLSNIGGGSGGGSSIEIDTTLTQSGKAADAKAAGDAIANKVDKVSGKGLSTNDYTDEDKATLDGMSSDVEDVVDQIDALFATDALKGVLDKKGTVSNGVTFTYDRTTNRYYAVGTANRNGIYRLANNVPLPSALQPGHTYTADWQRSQAKLYVVISFDGGSSFVIDTSVSSKLTFTVPESATTMLVEIRTTWNATVDDWCSISITGDGSFISRVNEMGSSINALKGDNFPGYYADQMDEAIERIQSNIEQFGHFGDSFVFFTDAHWGLNQKHSPQLIKHILAKTNVRNVLFGGDALDSGSKISEISKGRDFMEAFDFVPGGLKFCIGNHDSNRIGHGSDSSYWMTANQCYGIFGAAANQEAKEVSCPVSNYPNFYYYFDVPATNMRYLMIGSPYGNILPDEITWITNQITNNPTLGFVLVAHYLANDAAVITWQDFISTFFNLLDQHSNVKAVIFGHMHLDHVWYTPGGIPVIATDTDAASRLSEYNPNTATVGTITEHCFDTMTIDLGTNDVYCVRVGRGKNRIVRAGNNTVSSGSTTTLTSILTSPSWSSYDTSVATVSNGVVTGVASGRTYVVAQTDTDAEYWHIVVT